MGLTGAGGAILALLILIYLLGIEPINATSYVLLISAVSALAGAIENFFKGRIRYEAVGVFGVPMIGATYVTRRYLLDIVPDPIFSIAGYTVAKPVAMMILLAMIMMVAAFSMIRAGNRKSTDSHTLLSLGTLPPKERIRLLSVLLFCGIAFGVLTAILGVGGGFLIVPVLTLVMKLPIKDAIGSSLTIVALKSSIGVLGDMQAGRDIDFMLLSALLGLGVLGVLLGGYATNYIDNKQLKTIFGFFLLGLAVLILVDKIVLS